MSSRLACSRRSTCCSTCSLPWPGRDYDDRRRWQAQGQAKANAKAAGLYRGCAEDAERNAGIAGGRYVLEHHTVRYRLFALDHRQDRQARQEARMSMTAIKIIHELTKAGVTDVTVAAQLNWRGVPPPTTDGLQRTYLACTTRRLGGGWRRVGAETAAGLGYFFRMSCSGSSPPFRISGAFGSAGVR
jgi:hypothetical protein